MKKTKGKHSKEHNGLTNPDLLTILAYAPAGFGHIRVTDALFHGLPRGVRRPLLLGSHDPWLVHFHRFFSNHALSRRIFEWSQYGWREYVFTSMYRSFLRSRITVVYNQLLTILDQRIEPPKTILIVATHFALAHQIGKIKKRIEREKRVKIFLVVQVTDDSPQYLWYVPEADLTCVPSGHTKHDLLEYGRKKDLSEIQIEIMPYPVSLVLVRAEDRDFCEEKFGQVQPEKDSAKTHIIIPISGAAAGLEFLSSMIDELHRKSDRYVFHVVIKLSAQTSRFIHDMEVKDYVDLHVSISNRQAVNRYDEVYKSHMIAIEVTKPSEQAFKALLQPTQLGGAILLFAPPVGRQEYDNTDFLRRHGLIPGKTDLAYLWNHAEKGLAMKAGQNLEIHEKAGKWRGLELPDHPSQAAEFIHFCLRSGIFSRMMNCRLPRLENNSHQELNPNGIRLFWERMNRLLLAG